VADFKTVRDGVRQASSGTSSASGRNRSAAEAQIQIGLSGPQHCACGTQNLLRWPFEAAYPDQIWVTDVTFIPTRSGWLYLAVMIDLHARLVVGWSMKDRPNHELVNEALIMAVEQRRPKPGLIHHSDQGILYSSRSYLALLKKYGMLRSMSGKGNCYDNAVAESFFSSLKNEIVHHRNYHTRDEARAEIFEYIELFYNRKRLHQSLDYQTPMKYKSVKVSPN
jgi:putative transposase